jgi:uncharacterized protein (DUF362 family)
MQCTNANRRVFLKTALAGGLGAVGGMGLPCLTAAAGAAPAGSRSRVALTTGDDRAQNVFQSLKTFGQEIAQAIGNRRVIVKPNNVSTTTQLAATHADCLEGILEFLKSIGKVGQAVIAESSAGNTLDGFANFGYPKVATKYGVKLVNLDDEPSDVMHVFDETDFRPHAVRMSRLLLDPNSYLISAAMLKTHQLVVATLSLKNIVLGAPVKSARRSDKRIVHGGGTRGINYNLFLLAERLHPHLAVIDGYEGMEGRGPSRGTPVDHRVCVASTDWLAADRVAVKLMGIDFGNIGYLTYCAEAQLGEADLKRIEILGPPIKEHARKYELPPDMEELLLWKKPPQLRG